MHFAEPTFLSKGRVLEVVWFNHKVRGDVLKSGQRSKERGLNLIAPSSTLALA